MKFQSPPPIGPSDALHRGEAHGTYEIMQYVTGLTVLLVVAATAPPTLATSPISGAGFDTDTASSHLTLASSSPLGLAVAL